MSPYRPIDTAPKDREILVVDVPGGEPYITRWWEGVWTDQGGKGGPAGWFGGRYMDSHGDRPVLDRPVRWCEIPRDE